MMRPDTRRTVLAFGPATGGVGDSFLHTVARLTSTPGWRIVEEQVRESPVPVRGALATIRRHRQLLRDCEAVHVELGSNDRTLFWLALLLAVRRRTVVVVLHDFPLLVNHPAAGLLPVAGRWMSRIGYRVLSPLLDHALKRLLLRRAGTVAVLGEEVRGSWWSEEVRGELVVVPHGSFPPSEVAVPPSVGRYVLFAGFIGPSKGLDVLLAAWERLGAAAPLALVIAGDSGSPRDLELTRMKQRSQTFARPPLWLGFVESERGLEDLIARAAVVVLPYRRSSPASGILARAMLEGRAIIATLVPAAERAIRHRVDGLLVAPGQADDLAEALGELLADPPARDKLGASARERAQSLFSSTRQCELLLGAYERVSKCG